MRNHIKSSTSNFTIKSAQLIDSFSPAPMTFLFTDPKTKIKKVIIQPEKRTVIVIFQNGEKSFARCTPEDTFNAHVGVAIAIAKHFVNGNSELKKLVRDASIQNIKKKKK